MLSAPFGVFQIIDNLVGYSDDSRVFCSVKLALRPFQVEDYAKRQGEKVEDVRPRDGDPPGVDLP